jgi:hypothetical protein
VRHYGPILKRHGVSLFIATSAVKNQIVGDLKLDDRLEADKIDVLLTGRKGGRRVFFGVVHVKASFAERRTDDVPMSQTLVRAGYCSPLWTMDCKITPSNSPHNRGELGQPLTGGRDTRSAKRKDIEDDGFFSACFSYNSNTIPTPTSQKARARIVVCDFKNPDDEFARFIVAQWRRFSAK